MTTLNLLTALVIAVGLVGILIPILPGSALVLAAVVVWAALSGGSGPWITAAVVVTILAAGTALKYALPGRRLRAHEIPGSTLLIGGALGVVGFFVVPVVGLLLGFVLGVYLAEVRRLGGQGAWGSTRQALRAAGLSVFLELTAGLVAAGVWALSVVLW